jgi:hypothetical protein
LAAGTYTGIVAGRSLAYSLGVTVFGVGLTTSTIYTNSHYLQNSALKATYATHDIWSNSCNPNANNCHARAIFSY